MNVKEKINIAFSLDDNYCTPFFVVLYSLFLNFKNKDLYFINIFVLIGKNGVKKEHQLIFEDFIKKNGGEIIFITIDNSIFSNFRTDFHITETTYYRIILPEIISLNESKIIYLDCDLLVLGDISELWNIDVSLWSIAAVSDIYFDRYKELGMPLGEKYFNAGVLIVNLDYWRKNNLSNKILDFAKNNNDKLIYWDQDALNAVLYSKWLPINPKYNCQTGFFNKTKSMFYSKNDINLAISEPFIVHFTSKSKPWNFENVHPYKKLYKKYSLFVPKNLPPMEDKKTFSGFVKKIIKIISPNLYTYLVSLFLSVKK